MIKYTVLRLPYSRHKLTYENEAVLFAYSYITTNSQTRANKLAILLGPWCRCHQPADGWLQAGNSSLPVLWQLLAQGRARAAQENPVADSDDASTRHIWRGKVGLSTGPPGTRKVARHIRRTRKTGFWLQFSMVGPRYNFSESQFPYRKRLRIKSTSSLRGQTSRSNTIIRAKCLGLTADAQLEALLLLPFGTATVHNV